MAVGGSVPFRVVAIWAALLAGLFACGTDPETPYVVLRIEDPANVGAAATSLVLTDASGNESSFSTQSRVFPITVTLTSKRDGVQVVTVELFEGSRRIARGTASINVLVQRGKEIAVSLVAVCEGAGCEPPGPACSTNAQCQDELFCNGEEVCEAGVCRSGMAPCGAEKCDERNGCGTTEPPECGVSLPSCDDGLVCNGTETCVDGQCVDGQPPQTNTACRSVICDEEDGVRYTLAPDGTQCTFGAGTSPGVCYAGECQQSPYTPQCDKTAKFDVFAEGNIFGGPTHGITVNSVQFLEVGPSGFEPSWTVADDDLRPGSLMTSGTPSQFVLAIANPYYLRSFGIRVAGPQTCYFESSPAGIYDIDEVSSTSFITITLPEPTLGSDPQIIRFYFGCAPASQIRIDNFCMWERT